MKLKCFVIDDEPLARRGLKEFIADTDILTFSGEANNPVAALRDIAEMQPDIIFLDIQMAGMNGLEFIQVYRPQQHIILTTAYSNYAVEAFNLEVSDYLLKPVTYARFLNTVSRVLKSRQPAVDKAPSEGFIFIKTEGKYRKILHDEIYFVQALQNYVIIQLKDRKYITHITLSGIEAQLPAADFIKVHKSYIVNSNKVETIYGNRLLMDEYEIPLSRVLKEEVKKAIFSNRLVV